MLPTSDPDRIDIAFDDDRLVADAGLLLPATLAQHLGLQELADSCVDLGDAPGRANAGDKLMTLIASALAGGECIDDAAALRAGGTASVLGCTVKAPSTLGTFLRSFSWGHVRQLDRVSRELLARSWAAGAGSGDAPFTIDLDSTICETYGLAKEGARHHGYTGVRGYHPLLAVAAGTGDVLMARLREGRANTARGAAHFLRETVARVRDAGEPPRVSLADAQDLGGLRGPQISVHHPFEYVASCFFGLLHLSPPARWLGTDRIAAPLTTDRIAAQRHALGLKLGHSRAWPTLVSAEAARGWEEGDARSAGHLRAAAQGARRGQEPARGGARDGARARHGATLPRDAAAGATEAQAVASMSCSSALSASARANGSRTGRPEQSGRMVPDPPVGEHWHELRCLRPPEEDHALAGSFGRAMH